MYLVEVNFCYLFGCILKIVFYHKYIRAAMLEAKFKVVNHTQFNFCRYCFRLRILDIVLRREVPLGTRIRSSNSGSLLRAR